MSGKRDPSGNKEVSDLELFAAGRRGEAGSSAPLNPDQILEAILYLDPDLDCVAPTQGENRTLVRCIAAVAAFFYVAMFFLIRHWLP